MIFVRLLSGRCIEAPLPPQASVSSLSAFIHDTDGLPPSAQVLLFNGAPLCPHSTAPLPGDGSTVTVLARLCGGKGGFGARLRAATSKVGTKKVTDNSACRDLSGRRIRHVEAERALRQWIADEHNATPAEVAARFAAINKGEGERRVRKPCRFGAECTTRLTTCPRSHPNDGAEEHAERERVREVTNLGRRFGQDTGQRDLEGVGETDRAAATGSVAEGLAAAAASTLSVPAAAVVAPKKSAPPAPAGDMFGLGLDLGSSDDDDDDGKEDGSEEKKDT